MKCPAPKMFVLPIGIVVGLAASCAALYGRYFDLPGFLTGPKTCKLEHGGCEALFRSRNAALLGLPNALYGMAFYLLLIVGLREGWASWLLVSGATLALLMSIRLAYSLRKRRLECRICWAGHWANAILWLALVTRL